MNSVMIGGHVNNNNNHARDLIPKDGRLHEPEPIYQFQISIVINVVFYHLTSKSKFFTSF